MSYMESAMQDQIDGSIALQNQICDDACDVYKKTHLMASDLLKQHAELLEALKFAKEKIVELFIEIGEDEFVNFAIIDDAIDNAEK